MTNFNPDSGWDLGPSFNPNRMEIVGSKLEFHGFLRLSPHDATKQKHVLEMLCYGPHSPEFAAPSLT